MLTGPILEIGGMDAFPGAHLSKKEDFIGLHPQKNMLFLTASNQNIFLKTQGTRLGVIVAPNKGLEWALTGVTQSSEYA